MSKWIAFFLLMTSSYLLAAPIGNPSSPDIIEEGFVISPAAGASIRVGYEGNFVSDERLRQYREGKGRVDTFQQDVNSGTLTLNILNRIDFYGVLGASRIQADWRFENNNVETRIETETNYRLAWAAGTNILLLTWGNTSLGAGGRYSFTKPSISWLTSNGAPVSNVNTDIKFKEWQGDLGFSHKIDIFMPYIGVKYTNAKAKIIDAQTPISNSGDSSNYMKRKYHVGVYLGCTISNAKLFMLNLEARLIDEEAVTIAGDIRF